MFFPIEKDPGLRRFEESDTPPKRFGMPWALFWHLSSF